MEIYVNIYCFTDMYTDWLNAVQCVCNTDEMQGN